MKEARCVTGKKKSTMVQAKKEARYMMRNKRLPGYIPNAYHCNSCGWWHVGNTEK